MVPSSAGTSTGLRGRPSTTCASMRLPRKGPSSSAAVMVVPPFYGAPTWPELLAHISAVADRVSIPIMYYNIPSITGVTLIGLGVKLAAEER